MPQVSVEVSYQYTARLFDQLPLRIGISHVMSYVLPGCSLCVRSMSWSHGASWWQAM